MSKRKAESTRKWRIEVLPERDDLMRVAAEIVTATALIATSRRDAFRFALAGGSTPQPLYRRLANDPDIDWQRWHLFWGDERCVPPTHEESNYHMVRTNLLDLLPQPPGLTVRMAGELEPEEASLRYERSLRDLVPADFDRLVGDLPRFDMILLGMGADGHTASLFPYSPSLDETERLVLGTTVTVVEDGEPMPIQDQARRLTFTYPTINAARRILILVSGVSKAETLRDVLSGRHDPKRLPIQNVNPLDGQTTWLVDEAAFSSVASMVDETDETKGAPL